MQLSPSLIQRWIEHPRLCKISPDALPNYVLSAMLGITEYYKDFDPSHDEAHGIRVFRLGREIYYRTKSVNPRYLLHPDSELFPGNHALQILDLACVFHDFFDRKYFRTEQAYTARKQLLVELLVKHANVDQNLAKSVVLVADNSGFSKMTHQDGKLAPPDLGPFQNILLIMSDADRLDAVIGAASVDRAAQFQLYRIRWLIAEGRTEENKKQYDRFVAPIADLNNPVEVRKQAWLLAIFYTLEQKHGCRSERASTVTTPAGQEILAANEQKALDRAGWVKARIDEGKVPEL